jgi:hypothetical protein
MERAREQGAVNERGRVWPDREQHQLEWDHNFEEQRQQK